MSGTDTVRLTWEGGTRRDVFDQPSPGEPSGFRPHGTARHGTALSKGFRTARNPFGVRPLLTSTYPSACAQEHSRLPVGNN